jgi:hypothetical protein
MKTRLVAAVVTAAWLMLPGESLCQSPGGVMITTAVGVSTPVAGNAFADGFGRGGTVSLGAWYGLGGSWRPWFDFELHEFSYNRGRFFDKLGIPNVDLTKQLETGTALWSLMMGMDFVPWASQRLQPYVRGGLGFAHRDDGASPVLVSQYCGFRPAGPVAPDNVDDHPAYCAQAWNEVGSDFDALGVQVGIGTTVRVSEHLSGFVDLRLSRAFASSAPSLFPARVGVVAHR